MGLNALINTVYRSVTDSVLRAIAGWTGFQNCAEPAAFARFNGTDNYLVSPPFAQTNLRDEGTVIVWFIPVVLPSGNVKFYDIGNGITASDFTTRMRIAFFGGAQTDNLRVVLGDTNYGLVADVTGILEGAGAGRWRYNEPNLVYLTYHNNTVGGGPLTSRIQVGLNGLVIFDDTYENAGGGNGALQVAFNAGDTVVIGARHNLSGNFYNWDLGEIFSAPKFMEHSANIDSFLGPVSTGFPNGSPVLRPTGAAVNGVTPSNHFGGENYAIADWNAGNNGVGSTYTLNGPALLTGSGVTDKPYAVKFNSLISYTDHTDAFLRKNWTDATTIPRDVDPEFANGCSAGNGTATQWGCNGSTIINAGLALIDGDAGFNNSLRMSRGNSGIPNNTLHDIIVDVQDIGGGTLEVAINDGAAALPVITTSGVTTYTDIDSSGPGIFAVYNVTNGTTAIINSIYVLEKVPQSGEELPATSLTVSPTKQINYDEPTWAIPLASLDKVEWRYGGGGTYVDPNNFTTVSQDFVAPNQNLHGFISVGFGAWSNPGLQFQIINNAVETPGGGTVEANVLPDAPYSVAHIAITNPSAFQDAGMLMGYTDTNNTTHAMIRGITGGANTRITLTSVIAGVSESVTLDVTGAQIANGLTLHASLVDGVVTAFLEGYESDVLDTTGIVQGLPINGTRFGLRAVNAPDVIFDSLLVGVPTPLPAQILPLTNCLDSIVLNNTNLTISNELNLSSNLG